MNLIVTNKANNKQYVVLGYSAKEKNICIKQIGTSKDLIIRESPASVQVKYKASMHMMYEKKQILMHGLLKFDIKKMKVHVTFYTKGRTSSLEKEYRLTNII